MRDRSGVLARASAEPVVMGGVRSEPAASEPPAAPDPGHYYLWGNADADNIFTGGGTLTDKFDNGISGDTTSDERGPESAFGLGTVGIYWGVAKTIDEIKIVPGYLGSLSLEFIEYCDETGESWTAVTGAAVPGYGPRGSYGAGAQGLITFSDISCFGLRVGLVATGGSPFSQVGCYDLRGFNNSVEQPA